MLNLVAPWPIQRGACIFLHSPSLRSNHPYLYSSDINEGSFESFQTSLFCCNGQIHLLWNDVSWAPESEHSKYFRDHISAGGGTETSFTSLPCF